MGTASVHVGDDHWPDVLVLHSTLEFVVPGGVETIVVGVVLQVALSTLVTDRAVEGMVGQDELHDSSTGDTSGLRSGVNAHGRSHLGAAGGDGLGSLFNFNKAHPAVASNLKALVVAETRDFNSIFLGSLEDGEVVIDLS